MKQKIIDFWKNSAILSQITKAENRYFRRRCENTHYTILTPNCMAGLIYSRLGEPFYSPTINTSMQNEDFIKFLSDLDYYWHRMCRNGWTIRWITLWVLYAGAPRRTMYG